MSAIGKLVVSIVGDIGQLKQAFAEVGNEVGQLGSKMQSAGKQMASAGKTMSLAVTAPLMGIATLSYKMAVDFDDSMRKVMAVSGATGEEFEQLRALARELGATTAFSASEAAEGMQYLAMAGFDVNEILAATDDMLNLASAGAIDLGTAADIASNVLTGFGLTADQAGRVADVLAKAAASSNTDIQQLGEAMSYAAPLAAAMGMSMEEAAALIGKMSDAGIQGSRAGTALRGAMTRLASPTAGVAKALEKYGLTVADVDPSTRSFTDILETLSKAGLSTADAMELFGQEAGPGMLALMSTGTDAIREQTLALENAGGAAQEMADIMQGGPGGAARELKSAMEELMIAIGDVVTVGVLPLVKGLTELAQWLSKIPAPVLEIIVVLGAIAAAVGPVLIVAGTLISSIGTITTAIAGAGGLSAVLTTVVGILTGPVAIAIAAFAAAAYIVYKNWDTVGPLVQRTFDTIKEAATPVIELIKHFVTDALEVFGKWWTDNSPVITAAVSVIASAIMWLIESHIKVLLSVVQAVLPPIISIVSYVVEQIGNFIVLAAQLITGDWAGAWETAGKIVSTFVDFVDNIFSGLVNAVYNKMVSIYYHITNYWLMAKELVETVSDEIKNTLYKFLAGIYYDIANGWVMIKDFVDIKIDEIKNKITSVLDAISSTWTSSWNYVLSVPKLILQQIYAYIVNAMAGIAGTISGTANSLLSGWTGVWPQMVTALRNAITEIYTWLSNAGSNFYNAGVAWIQNLIDGIKSKISSVTSAVSSVVSSVRDYFPFSPAKEGALKKLPNWDAFFVDPILESTKGLENVVQSRMNDIAGMVPPIATGQASSVAGMANSQTNNIGGNTLIIQNMTLSKDYPFEQFMRDYESRMTQARVQRGIRG